MTTPPTPEPTAPPAWLAPCAHLVPLDHLAATFTLRCPASATPRQRQALWLDVASERLVVLAQTTGSQQSLAAETLVSLWAGEVLRWCRWQSGPALDPEDIAQDVLVCALQRIGRVREPALFRRWLHGLTWRRVLGQARLIWFRRRDPAPPVETMLRADTDPVAGIRRDEQARQVHAALARLPLEHRRLLWLHYVEELSRAEICALTDMPAGTLNRRLTEARRAFEAQASALGLADSPPHVLPQEGSP
ncbi:MAG: sigma-70 family RNA polymerase sigma factor [Pseudomonadota bacterium]